MIRRLSQIIGLLFANSYWKGIFSSQAIYQGATKRFCFPVLNCYSCPLARFACPIGSLQHFIAIRQIPYYILGIISLVGVFIGRVPCGWLCPFGLLQDVLYRIPSFKLHLHKSFGYLKYLVLVGVVVIVVYFTQEPWFCKLCPAGTLEAGIPLILWSSVGASLKALLGWHFYLKVGILLSIILLMVFIKRPFCRMLCPLGAIFGLFNRISLLRFYVDRERCKGEGCDICYNVCPMEIRIYRNPHSFDCIRCTRCISACPEKVVGITIIWGRIKGKEPVIKPSLG